MDKKYIKYYNRVCQECGKVDILQLRSNRANSLLCRSCSSKGEKGANWKGGLTEKNWTYKKVKKVCPECATKFITSKSYKKYCTQKCGKTAHNRLNHKAYKSTRRAREKNAEGSFEMGSFYRLIRDLKFRCPSCGVKLEMKYFTVDHIIPLSKGGSNYFDNIQPLCLGCNMAKNAKTINYLDKNLSQTEVEFNKQTCKSQFDSGRQ